MEIRTERLLLREFVEDDWRALYSYQNDTRYLDLYEWTHRTEPDVKAFVREFIEQQDENPRTKFQLAIVLQDERELQVGRVVGNVGLRKPSPPSRVAELGYEIDPRYWGIGYATEAARAMCKFAFDELRVHRVWAHCVANNVASTRVMEKLGMRQEGHLRESEYFKERWWNTLLYGILEDEWRWQIANRAYSAAESGERGPASG